MDRFLLFVIVLTCSCILAVVWFSIHPPVPIWLVLALVGAAGLGFIRSVELGLKRAHSALVDPKTQKKIQETAKQAATANEFAQVGSKAAISALLPRLQYLFSFSGRASRMEYFICQVGVGIALFLGFLLLSELGVLPLLVILSSVAILLAFGVRRTRDTGVNQWWFLLILVPPVNLAATVFLLLVPTDEFKGKGI
ncbi:DUF805 domain-containing protein [Sedimentitalea nanhaiensis]|uniref:Uncharacterized membrane protein YhaH, DUF805 family n=1 Tax=Sedimentitalea nanhaiensis TaxID=999627 RepID=A0A1I7ED78_9RHOB|nr:DUF805 domain-containing protein [Sedimentitalea nanhaiensis]SFU21884.1 Uncharacterized membrane protein YhaH, DUF805 family [Sedimentitalea nanhaiensis]